MFLEAEILHYLDIIDARVFDFEKALKSVEPGNFSDRVWVLDNRTVYNSEYDKNQEKPEILDGDQLRIDRE
jgi:3'-5' exoribonuclease